MFKTCTYIVRYIQIKGKADTNCVSTVLVGAMFTCSVAMVTYLSEWLTDSGVMHSSVCCSLTVRQGTQGVYLKHILFYSVIINGLAYDFKCLVSWQFFGRQQGIQGACTGGTPSTPEPRVHYWPNVGQTSAVKTWFMYSNLNSDNPNLLFLVHHNHRSHRAEGETWGRPGNCGRSDGRLEVRTGTWTANWNM